MTPRFSRIAAACLVVLVVGACGMTPSPSATSRPAAGSLALVNDSTSGIAFERPATWLDWKPNAHDPINDGPLAYISTDPLLPSCAVAPDASPNPPDKIGRACTWPLESLTPNGVFVDWLTTRILQPAPVEWDAIDMNGGVGRIKIERPGSCREIGADETISVWVPMPASSTTLSNIAIVACLRGPDLGSSEDQVRAMLASVTASR